jgi:hypothetical protein
MKKIHWSLVIGIIILALSLGLGAYNYSIFPNSTPVVVKTSFVVTNLFWAAFGLLLILNYFWNKNDSTEVITEDVSYLNKKQNKIFSYYIIVMLIASVDMWVTNNYSSGLNILNLTTIFDLILNLVLAYYVYILFTNKRNVGKELLYVLVVYCATWFFIDLYRGYWIKSAVSLTPLLYFVYAIKADLDHKKYRFINYVLLPLVIVINISISYLSSPVLSKLEKTNQKVYMEYTNASTDLNAAYSLIFQKETPNIVEIKDIKDKSITLEEKINAYLSSLDNLKAEQEKQMPSTSKIMALKSISEASQTMEIYLRQDKKIQEFSTYFANLNLKNLTDEQKLKISSYVKEIEGFNIEARTLSVGFLN